MDNQRIMYYCNNCNQTYTDYPGNNQNCPVCHRPLYQSNIKMSDWDKYSRNEKIAQRAAWSSAIFDKEKQYRLATKAEALSKMLITSGFSFDGYTITKYSGYISGDDAISIGRGTDGLFSSPTHVGEALTRALVQIRRVALQELKEAAYDLGCNAVIGVDYDYITLEPETANSSGGTTYLPYVIAVTANGNAVVIEKNKNEDDGFYLDDDFDVEMEAPKSDLRLYENNNEISDSSKPTNSTNSQVTTNTEAKPMDLDSIIAKGQRFTTTDGARTYLNRCLDKVNDNQTKQALKNLLSIEDSDLFRQTLDSFFV